MAEELCEASGLGADGMSNCAGAHLASIAKSIHDLDTLVKLLQQAAAGRPKTWQRLLADQLADVDRLLEVLRLTISLERGELEILVAAKALRDGCGRAFHSVTGTRADATTRAALKLVRDLAISVATQLDEAGTAGAHRRP